MCYMWKLGPNKIPTVRSINDTSNHCRQSVDNIYSIPKWRNSKLFVCLVCIICKLTTQAMKDLNFRFINHVHQATSILINSKPKWKLHKITFLTTTLQNKHKKQDFKQCLSFSVHKTNPPDVSKKLIINQIWQPYCQSSCSKRTLCTWKLNRYSKLIPVMGLLCSCLDFIYRYQHRLQINYK